MMTENEIIEILSKELSGVQKKRNAKFESPRFPTTYIVGCPRSGTTALLQYLASTNTWIYPTNFLARFSSSIYLGGLIQELCFNSEFGLTKAEKNNDFSSEYGRSKGPLNANEFFHFFRNHFPNNEIRHLDSSELLKVDIKSIQSEIASVVDFYQKPFLSKGLMLQFNLKYFFENMKNLIFLYIKRKPKYVMQSIYLARKNELSNVNNWWSAKPKEYEFLKDCTVEEQIAGQVFFINKKIEEELSFIDEDSKLVVEYEEFIASPSVIYQELKKLYKNKDIVMPIKESSNIDVMKSSNNITIDEDVLNKMEMFYKEFEIENVKEGT